MRLIAINLVALDNCHLAITQVHKGAFAKNRSRRMHSDLEIDRLPGTVDDRFSVCEICESNASCDIKVIKVRKVRPKLISDQAALRPREISIREFAKREAEIRFFPLLAGCLRIVSRNDTRRLVALLSRQRGWVRTSSIAAIL